MTVIAVAVLLPFAVAVAGLLFSPLRSRVLPVALVPIFILILADPGVFTGKIFRLTGPLGVALLPDETARLMILLSCLVGLGIRIWAGGNRPMTSWFHPLALLMIGSCNAVFVSYDLFNLYVTVELVTVLGFLLIRLEGGGRQIWASVKYLLLGNLGMTLFLLSLLRVYALTGDFALPAVARVPLSLVSLLVCGLAVKGGLFVFGLWLPEAHGGAPSPVSALLSGVVVLTGIIPILRLAAIRPDLLPLLRLMGVLSVLLGIALALRERDLKRMLACSTLSQLGLVLVAPDVGPFFAVGHGLCKAWLFLAAGDLPERRIDHLSSVPVPLRHWAGFALPCLVLAGLPGTVLWAAKGLIVQESGPGLSLFVKGSSLLTAFYLLRPLRRGALVARAGLPLAALAGPVFFAVCLFSATGFLPAKGISLTGPFVTLIAAALGAWKLPLWISSNESPPWEGLDHLMGGLVVATLILCLTGGMFS